MRGTIKVFTKDLHEMISRPYIALWLIIAPMLLLYVAGNSIVGSPEVRVLLGHVEPGDLTTDDVNELLNEFPEITITRQDWIEADTATIMGQNSFHLALTSSDRMKIFIRPSGGQQMDNLTALAYQIAASISFEKPWQVAVLEAGRGQTISDDTGQSWQSDIARILSVDLVAVGSANAKPNTLLVPRIICLIAAFLPFLVSCIAVIRDKENQMISVQLASPGIGWTQIVLGKSLTAVFFGMASLFAMLIFAVAVFDIPARTGVWSIVGVQFLAILVSTALGLIASTIVNSQLQAYFVSAFYGFSLMFLTGLLYPIDQAHAIVQVISRIVPLTFSHGPMSDWMLNGVYGWPFAEETKWLAGQLSVGIGLVIISYRVARRRY